MKEDSGEVIFFDSITISLPKEKIYKRLGYKEGITQLQAQQQQEVEHYIAEGISLIHLKAAAWRSIIKGYGPSKITLSKEIAFSSEHLSSWLQGCKEVLLMGATAGKDIIDAITKDSTKGNLSRAVIYDAMASEMVDAALDWVMDFFNCKLRRENKQLTPKRYSAGYGDFNLTNQKMIYEILKLKHLGVEITDSYILVPEKSVTAIAGIQEILSTK